MAVTDVKTLKRDWTGTIKATGDETTFSTAYLITVDDKLDGPESITEDSRLPQIGDLYDVGNDGNVSAKCQTKTFSNIDTFTWRCVAQFGNKKPEKPQDDGSGQERQDRHPLDISATLDIADIKTEVAISHAAFIGVFWVDVAGNAGAIQPRYSRPNSPLGQTHAEPGDPQVRGGIKNGTSVINSALAPFDPPLTRERSLQSFTVKRNIQTWPNDHQEWVGTVNKDYWILDHPHHNITLGFWPYTCKMHSVTGSFKYEQVNRQLFGYWEMQYEFHVDTIWGWREDLLDYGYDQNAGKHAPNQATLDDMITNNAPLPGGNVPIMGPTGMANRDPVKLNGGGKALLVGTGLDAYYSRWAKYPEIEWSGEIASLLNYNPLRGTTSPG